MKKIIFVILISFAVFEINSQENIKNYSLNLRLSSLNWNNQEITEYYGSLVLFGAGIGKFISENFKFIVSGDFGSKKVDDYALSYCQAGAEIKYSWRPFGTNTPNICGGLGFAGIFLSESSDGHIEKGNSPGFSALLALEIPLGDIKFDLGWNSVWSNMKIYDENINVGSQIFYGGLIFAF